MDKVFTCFDNAYFNGFGISWIASLRTLGGYAGPIYAISFNDLPQTLVNRLSSENVFLLDAHDKPKSRETVFDSIQKEVDGTFAYWDIDGYFLGDISSLVPKDKLMFVDNMNGFFAGNKNSLAVCSEYNRLSDFCAFKRDFNVHRYFPNLVDFVGSEWNYQKVNRPLPQGTKFVHFAGEMKNISTAFIRENLSFEAKYPEIHKEWAAKFHITTAKKLFRKIRNE
jgi:hypothetical protein